MTDASAKEAAERIVRHVPELCGDPNSMGDGLARDGLTVARAYLALLAASGWRTMEGAPRDGTSSIVGGPGYAYEAIFSNGEWMVMDADGATTTELVLPPTHWQPLPEPPTSEHPRRKP